MNFAVESSGKIASAALVSNGVVIAQSSQNSGLNHSRTLMPMIEDMLKNCGVKITDLTGFAVSAGPGSFTGLRIGMAAVKGMAMAANLPCAAVSSLESQAFGLSILEGVICVLSEAHYEDRFYFAAFNSGKGGFSRLSPDEVLSPSEISERLEDVDRFYLIGDGAERYYNIIKGGKASLIEEPWSQASAASVGLIGERLIKAGHAVPADMLRPVYLTLPQAERERLKRLEKQKAKEK